MSDRNPPLSFREWQIREGNPLYRAGVKQMSNTHLLAHLIRKPTAADQLMAHFGDICTIAEASVAELKQVKEVGVASAETIQAAFELSRRLSQTTPRSLATVYNPKDVYEILREDFQGQKQEILKVLLMNTKNRIEHIETVFIGTLNSSLIHPREIFRPAIRHSAASIILCHNHPSTDTQPSTEDVRATKEVARAGVLIQIPVLDHLIIGEGYFSMKEEGLF